MYDRICTQGKVSSRSQILKALTLTLFLWPNRLVSWKVNEFSVSWLPLWISAIPRASPTETSSLRTFCSTRIRTSRSQTSACATKCRMDRVYSRPVALPTMLPPRFCSTSPTMVRKLMLGAVASYFTPCSTASSHSMELIRVSCFKKWWTETLTLRKILSKSQTLPKTWSANCSTRTLSPDLAWVRPRGIHGFKSQQTLLAATLRATTAF